MEYIVLYASVGLLSGHQPGDVVTIVEPQDAKHLQDLGLICEATEEDLAKSDEGTDLEDRLEAFKKPGGWYHFPVDGGDPLKVKGREAALAELGRRDAAQQ